MTYALDLKNRLFQENGFLRINGGRIERGNGLVVGQVGKINAQTKEDTRMARLFIASEEMLAVLKDCVAVYEKERDADPTGKFCPDPAHIFNARLAIEKAEQGN